MYFMEKFLTIDYLLEGNKIQQSAYNQLIELNIMNILQDFNPLLVWTIPIWINIETSDLDILCECYNHDVFAQSIESHFWSLSWFVSRTYERNWLKITRVNFFWKSFEIEIYGIGTPTREQIAFKHMLIEHAILESKGEDFKLKVIDLKRSWIKTEPAFAQLLWIEWDPYVELLKMEWVLFKTKALLKK